MENNLFTNHICRGACYLLIGSFTKLWDEQSIFRDAQADFKIGAVSIYGESEAEFNRSKFLNNTAPFAANLRVENESKATLNHVTFEGSKARLGSACISSDLS